MRIRRELLRLLLDVIRRNCVTFIGIASMCGTSQSRAWKLLHGHIELFNSETLIDMLARFGVKVDVIVIRRERFSRYNKARE